MIEGKGKEIGWQELKGGGLRGIDSVWFKAQDTMKIEVWAVKVEVVVVKS